MIPSGPDALTPDPAILVRVEDLRAARLCLQGARPWFRRHGLNWQEFLAAGMSADQLAATGDSLALRVIAKARERIARDADHTPNTEGPSDGR